MDENTLFAHIVYVHSRALVANQVNTDLGIISDWSSMCGMLLNPNKSHSLIVSRAGDLQLPHSPLICNGSVIQESNHIKHLRIFIDSISQTTYLKRLVLCESAFLFLII